ncbi:MAG: hypothetical protein WC322_05100 [Candidatus Paceibacterota bacterium]|jgi:hypothetical protein
MEMNIESLVIKQVQAELEEMDLKGLIESVLANEISRIAKKELIDQVRDAATKLVSEQIRVILDGPINTDDGWGVRENYPSFEDLFKKHLAKAMNEKWEVKREIEKQVSSRIDSLIKQDYQKVIGKIVDEISKTRIAS